jgi:1-deoxy-D-xylulose-5-phosphate synthase
MLNKISATRPATPLLDRISDPADVRALGLDKLPELADQLRDFLLYSVGQTGGHFGAGLGIVELTLALHYVYDTPDDSLIWDVGHQCYPHKILTGRREAMLGMRNREGLAPFPKRSESPYDAFGTGHSSTSISAALGMAIAHKLRGESHRAVAIIGDGAMTGGMAFEALNHAAHTEADLLVILNDNDMSISHNVGGLASYLSKNLKKRSGASTTAALFEAVDFQYSGPIDGHDIPLLVQTLNGLKKRPGPQFLHILTTKGKGFAPAEADPVGYHAITKIEAIHKICAEQVAPLKYSDVFGQWLCDMAKTDERLIGITPAMSEGSGMVAFAEQFPERYFDVAIAEQHAVTLAAGMACKGAKPVVAIYSTFLQRAYDQLIHDVAIQNLDLLFAIDRAGLVGEDGPTHHGNFDLSFLACIPNLVIMAPADERETRLLLTTGFKHPGPACIRYPRGAGPGIPVDPELNTVPVGHSRLCRNGHGGAILSFGTLLESARIVAEELDLTLVDMRFIKPLDTQTIDQLARDHRLMITLEENAVLGGAGSLVNHHLAANHQGLSVLNLGLPDRFIEHGKADELLAQQQLDTAGILATIQQALDGMPRA